MLGPIRRFRVLRFECQQLTCGVSGRMLPEWTSPCNGSRGLGFRGLGFGIRVVRSRVLGFWVQGVLQSTSPLKHQ